jgi:hypothetical protein
MTTDRRLCLLCAALLSLTACSEPATAPKNSEPALLSGVQRAMSAQSRHFLAVDGGGFEGQTRSQQSARLDAEGLHLTTSAQGLDLRFSAWGSGIASTAVSPVTPQLAGCPDPSDLDVQGRCVARLEYRHPGLTEWWRNGPRGLQQGWTVDEAGDELVLAVEVESATVAPDGRSAMLPGKVHYGGLKAWDATGRDLDARMEATDDGLAIHVDVDGAVFPVEVDPLLTTGSVQINGDGAGDLLGSSVSAAGDLNGDGYADVVAGARWDDNNGVDSGSVFVFYGGPDGLFGGSAGVLADAVWTGDAAGDEFGITAASAGDVNGDGYGDVLVGASKSDTNGSDSGSAYIFHGSASGVSSGSASSVAATALNGDGADDWFGHGLGGVGDIDGDGFSDVAIAAPHDDNNGAGSGSVFVFHGSASGVMAGTATTAADTVLVGDDAEDEFGHSVDGAGDVNGDGYADVAVGARNDDNSFAGAGAAFVFHGSASGIATGAATVRAAAVLNGDGTSYSFGSSVAGAGDVNGDGFADVVVGSRLSDEGGTYSGAAYVFHGSGSGVTSGTASAVADTYLIGSAEGDRTGSSVAGAGDLNGDGYADILVDAYLRDSGAVDSGSAFLLFGSADGVPSGSIASVAALELEGDDEGDSYGVRLAGAGDLDGDGFGDVLVGSTGVDDNGDLSGSFEVFYGAGSVVEEGTADGVAAVAYEGESAGINFGYSVVGLGDLNGDGFEDVAALAGGAAAGVYVFHGSEEGLEAGAPTAVADAIIQPGGGSYLPPAIAAAGDVNGDGFDDLLLGVPANNSAATYSGTAYVFLGSPWGVTSGAAASVADSVIDGETGFDLLGAGTAGGGDVNGDGYDDIVLGVLEQYQTGAGPGSAHVLHGSATGIASGAVSSVADSTLHLDVAGTHFGESLAFTDLNGDGYDDLLVGAPGAQGAGAAFAFHGSALGITSGGAYAVADAALDGSFSNDVFGGIVCAAGDLNGDGFGDVAVANSDGSGLVWVFEGSAAGLPSGEGSAVADAAIEEAMGNSGSWVSAAGDVNGDGFGDLAVGSNVVTPTGDGSVFVLLGSTNGIPAGPLSAGGHASVQGVAGGPGGGGLGRHLTFAGDVNGDGYGDLFVGAYRTDPSGLDSGSAYLFLGNSGDGTTAAWHPTPRAFHPSTTDLIPAGGWSDAQDGFDISLQARSPFGRGGVKLQTEVKALGTVFDGTALITQSTWTDSGLDGVELTQPLSGLEGGTGYHWRARVLYEPVDGHPTTASRWVYGGRSGDPNGAHVVTACDGLDTDSDGLVDCSDPDDDNDGEPDDSDCEPLDDTIYPGAAEVCDDIDQDCDGDVLESFADDDGDGLADCIDGCVDADGDGFGTGANGNSDCAEAATDTDDSNSDLCTDSDSDGCDDCTGGSFAPSDDGADVDLDGLCDANDTCVDLDGDTLGDGTNSNSGCLDPTTDSDDTDASVCTDADGDTCDDCSQIGAPDPDDDGTDTDLDGTCDLTDLDDDGDCYPDADEATCGTDSTDDGSTPTDIDSDCVCDDLDTCIDLDGDGLGNGTGGNAGCAVITTDSDDGDVNVCTDSDGDSCDDCESGAFDPDDDGLDLDNDGLCDDGDADGDGEEAPTDCDDGDASINTSADEVCDEIDQDCDGSIIDEFEDLNDDGLPDCLSDDLDGDGSLSTDDCDDLDPDRYPGAAELCDGIDNDCDDVVDNDVESVNWYADSDGDGAGDEDSPHPDNPLCEDPGDGWVQDSGDCDDGDATLSSSGTESGDACSDGIDNDCDTLIDGDDPECASTGCTDCSSSMSAGHGTAALLLFGVLGIRLRRR